MKPLKNLFNVCKISLLNTCLFAISNTAYSNTLYNTPGITNTITNYNTTLNSINALAYNVSNGVKLISNNTESMYNNLYLLSKKTGAVMSELYTPINTGLYYGAIIGLGAAATKDIVSPILKGIYDSTSGFLKNTFGEHVTVSNAQKVQWNQPSPSPHPCNPDICTISLAQPYPHISHHFFSHSDRQEGNYFQGFFIQKGIFANQWTTISDVTPLTICAARVGNVINNNAIDINSNLIATFDLSEFVQSSNYQYYNLIIRNNRDVQSWDTNGSPTAIEGYYTECIYPFPAAEKYNLTLKAKMSDYYWFDYKITNYFTDTEINILGRTKDGQKEKFTNTSIKGKEFFLGDVDQAYEGANDGKGWTRIYGLNKFTVSSGKNCALSFDTSISNGTDTKKIHCVIVYLDDNQEEMFTKLLETILNSENQKNTKGIAATLLQYLTSELQSSKVWRSEYLVLKTFIQSNQISQETKQQPQQTLYNTLNQY